MPASGDQLCTLGQHLKSEHAVHELQDRIPRSAWDSVFLSCGGRSVKLVCTVIYSRPEINSDCVGSHFCARRNQAKIHRTIMGSDPSERMHVRIAWAEAICGQNLLRADGTLRDMFRVRVSL